LSKTAVIKNKQLFSLQVFNAMRFGIAILIAIVLAKIADTETINIYESLVLIGTTFTFFYASAINHTLVPFAEGTSEEGRKTIYYTAFRMLLIGVIISTLAMFVYAHTVSKEPEQPYLYLYIAFIMFNTPALLAENILLIEKRLNSLVIYGALAFGLQLAAVSIPLLFGNLMRSILLLAVVGILKFGYTIFLINKYNIWSKSKEQFKTLFKVSSPVMGSLFLANGYLYISTFLIKFNSSAESFNIFRYGSREFPLFMILANSFSTIQSGLLAKAKGNIDSALEQMKKSSVRLMNQLFPIAILLSLSSSFLFKIAFNDSLAEAYQIFNILLLILLSRLLFPQSILLAIKKNRPMLTASFLEFTLGISLSIVLIQTHGIIGVAWAMVAAHIIDKVVLCYYAHKEGFALNSYFPWKIYLVYSIPLVILVILL